MTRIEAVLETLKQLDKMKQIAIEHLTFEDYTSDDTFCGDRPKFVPRTLLYYKLTADRENSFESLRKELLKMLGEEYLKQEKGRAVSAKVE